MNGVDVFPGSGDKVVVDSREQTLRVTGSNTQVKLGSIPVFSGPLPTISLGAAPLALKLPAGVQILGMPVTGDLTFGPVDGAGFDITANAEIGFADQKGFTVTGAMTLHTSNSTGLVVSDAELSVKDVPLTGADEGPALKEATLRYSDANGGTWTGQVTVAPFGHPAGLGASVGKSALEFGGSLTISGGRISEVGVEADNINKAVGEIVYLQKLGLTIDWTHSLMIRGLVGLSAGPVLPVLDAPAVSLDTALTLTFSNPVVVEVTGNAMIGDKVDLGSVDAKWTVPNSFYLSAATDFTFGPASVQGAAAGWVTPDGFGFKGDANVSVPGASGRGFVYLSEKGITACVLVSAGPVSVTGGFGYPWGGDLQLWFDDGCIGALAFNTAAKPPSSGAASTSGSWKVKVPAGSQTLIAAFGTADPPSFTLRSPSGQLVDPSHGIQGAIDRGGYRIVNDQTRHGTYVLLGKPSPGIWTLTPIPGSPDIVRVGTAQGAPATHEAVTVQRSGNADTLRWRGPRVAGQTLRFMETGSGVGRTLLTTSSATGSFRFVPTDTGRGGTRQIQMLVTVDGLPKQQVSGPSFTVSTPAAPAPPTRLSIRRNASSIRVSWLRVNGANRYDVWITASDGRHLHFDQPGNRPVVTLSAFPGRDTISISVRAVASDGVTSRPARTTLTLVKRTHK